MQVQRIKCRGNIKVPLHLFKTALPVKGPKITGMHPWYNLGANVTAKCTVHKGFPAPKLHWFVNSAQVNDL